MGTDTTSSKEDEYKQLREHVTNIAYSLGFALSATIAHALTPEARDDNLVKAWMRLGNNICDLGEWLDG